MAVSGRKISDFQSSLGSAKDFEHNCDSCLEDEQDVEAYGYCVNCSEYLCKQCFKCHQRTKASKHHKLLDKDSMDKHVSPSNMSNICTEHCSVRAKEVIKFFCPKHDALGCHDCMTLGHRTCDLDYIPNKCADFGESDEYKKVINILQQETREAEAVMKSARKIEQEIDDRENKALRAIAKFRKEMIEHLDNLQGKMETEVKKKKAYDKQKVQEVIAECRNITSDIHELKSSLQSNKATSHNAQLFMNIKRVKSKQQSLVIQKTRQSLEETRTVTVFQRNDDLEKLLTIKTFGKLVDDSVVSVPVCSEIFPRVAINDIACKSGINMAIIDTVHKTVINIPKQKSERVCNIKGCVAIGPNKLVIADFKNKTLKLLDTKRQVLLKEIALDSCPADITLLPEDKIVVPLPDKKK